MGNVKADADKRTSVAKVFTAGDMTRGQSLIVWAIAEGRHAARSIDEFLMGVIRPAQAARARQPRTAVHLSRPARQRSTGRAARIGSQKSMNIARREKMTAVLGTMVGVLSILRPVPGALGQTAPGYSELFQDPARTDQLTRADLPNMGRLVVLEATSMFVHARSELRDSPDSYLLLDEITTLWNAADAFTAAVSFYPLESQRIQAGRLTFPDLEEAFYQVRNTLGTMPGIATRTAENFVDMSSVIAVIGPLLEQTPPGPLMVEDPREFDPVVITNQARELSSAIVPLKTHVKAETGGGVKLETLDREIDVLEKLIQGFERISSGGANERDLVASFRPVRARAQRINRELQRVNLGGAGLSLWRHDRAANQRHGSAISDPPRDRPASHRRGRPLARSCGRRADRSGRTRSRYPGGSNRLRKPSPSATRSGPGGCQKADNTPLPGTPVPAGTGSARTGEPGTCRSRDVLAPA